MYRFRQIKADFLFEASRMEINPSDPEEINQKVGVGGGW